MGKFNFNIDNIENDYRDSLLKTNKHSQTQINAYKNSMYVDLELPSGILWGMYNLGVDPIKYSLEFVNNWTGNYYAWGEIETKEVYDQKTYRFLHYTPTGLGLTFTKYCDKNHYQNNPDHKHELDLEDDAANAILGSDWRIPSRDDVYELLENTESNWVENYNDIEGLNGTIFTSIKNDNFIFIPAGGYFDNDDFSTDLTDGCIWTSTLDDTYNINACVLYIDQNSNGVYVFSRYLGIPIRPIIKK